MVGVRTTASNMSELRNELVSPLDFGERSRLSLNSTLWPICDFRTRSTARAPDTDASRLSTAKPAMASAVVLCKMGDRSNAYRAKTTQITNDQAPSITRTNAVRER